MTKQIGIRLPVALWDRVQVVAAAAGKRPGGYVKALLDVAVEKDERALAGRLAQQVTKRPNSKK